MPAAEIARELVRGGIELGVTGADLIGEATEASEQAVLSAHPLGFGKADVVVAVPDPWIDVTRMADLADVAADFRPRHHRWLRIATKYGNLTLTEAPRGRSPDEETKYEAKTGWGRLVFGFAERNPDCLSSVGFVHKNT